MGKLSTSSLKTSSQPQASSSLHPPTKQLVYDEYGNALNKSEIALQKRVDKMDKAGVTDDRMLKTLKDGLEAVTVEEELRDGEVIKTEVPDHSVRQKYLDIAFKAKGYYTPVEMKTEVNVGSVGVSINLSQGDISRLELIASTLKSMNESLDMGRVQSGEVLKPSNFIEADFKASSDFKVSSEDKS